MPVAESGDDGATAVHRGNDAAGLPTAKTRLAILVEPFEQLIRNVEEVHKLLRWSMQGIAVRQTFPQALRAIAKAHGKEEESDSKRRIEAAEADAAAVAEEVAAGFPLLHAQSTVTLWTVLELAIQEYVVRWLETEPEVTRIRPISQAKITLGEYLEVAETERARFLAELLDRNTDSRLRPGLGRFEPALSAFGIHAEVDEAVRRDILELQSIRNLLVHRHGVVDRRFVGRCPWLERKVGEQLRVPHGDFKRYSNAVMSYVTAVMYATGDAFGRDLRSDRP